MVGPRFLDYSEWDRLGRDHRDAFATAEPFHHVVIDDAFPRGVLEEIVAELPDPEAWDAHDAWMSANRPDAIKKSVPNDWELGPATRQLLNQFNSAVFVNFLEQLTGIEGLLPDPYYFGGGLHQIEQGGFLKIHADFNVHHRLKVDRRLNALLYLNEGWQDAWGGHLELWDHSMEHAVVKIAPVFNRLVVFATTDTSYHGHPDPLRCPPGVRRRSLALYYYTNGRPPHEQSPPHSTLHQVRPGEDFDPNPAPAPVDAESASVHPSEPETVPSPESNPPVPASPGRRRKPVTWREFVPPVAGRAKRYLRAKVLQPNRPRDASPG
jgi:hypothetical protein